MGRRGCVPGRTCSKSARLCPLLMVVVLVAGGRHRQACMRVRACVWGGGAQRVCAALHVHRCAALHPPPSVPRLTGGMSATTHRHGTRAHTRTWQVWLWRMRRPDSPSCAACAGQGIAASCGRVPPWRQPLQPLSLGGHVGWQQACMHIPCRSHAARSHTTTAAGHARQHHHRGILGRTLRTP